MILFSKSGDNPEDYKGLGRILSVKTKKNRITPVGASWAQLGASWVQLGASWTFPGLHLAPLGLNLAPPGPAARPPAPRLPSARPPEDIYTNSRSTAFAAAY